MLVRGNLIREFEMDKVWVNGYYLMYNLQQYHQQSACRIPRFLLVDDLMTPISKLMMLLKPKGSCLGAEIRLAKTASFFQVLVGQNLII